MGIAPNAFGANRLPEEALGLRVTDVTLREYKDWSLMGGTLLVSVPQFGTGGVLLTDHVLASYRMDHLAAIDCDEFPPVAMVRKGKARFPMRVHADPASRLAVLRSELRPAPHLARPLAQLLLEWAKEKGVAQVIVLDNLGAEPDGDSDRARPPIYAVAATEAGRARVQKAGIEELDGAVLGGLVSMLLLEARFAEVDLIALVAELRSAVDEAQSPLAFAEALPKLIPELRLDLEKLRSESKAVAETVRALQSEIERTVRKLGEPDVTDQPPIYG